MSSIKLYILNQDLYKPKSGEDVNDSCATWHGRNKSYEWDDNFPMDEDVKNCTVGHLIERLEIDGFILYSKEGVRDLIEFLQKSENSFKY